MSKQISYKQLLANRENAQKGGVKTDEGKTISRMNALSFGIYSPVLFNQQERENYMLIRFELMDEYKPEGRSEESLINEVALYEVKLQRVAWMEEYFNSLCSLENLFITRDEFPGFNEESVNTDQVLQSMYGLLMGSTNILKVRNLDQIQKVQVYRDMLENKRSKTIQDLMKIKFLKRNSV